MSRLRPEDDDNGGLKLILAIVLIPVCLCAAGLLYFVHLNRQPPRVVRIATGAESGTYFPLGQGIAAVLDARIPDLVKAEVLATAGSLDNLGRLERGEVELAFVQNDTDGTPGNPHQIRSVAVLYKEVLHVLARRRPGIEVETIFDLGRLPKPIAIGGAGSGTEALVKDLLSHFGLSNVETVSLGTREAIDAFELGEIDGVCIVSGLRSPAANRLLASREAELVPLGAIAEGSTLDAIRVELPYVTRAVIPERVYGAEPSQPVGTVGVEALLLAREDLPEDLVRAITQTIFHNKVDVARRHIVGAQISESFDGSRLRFPLHEGAIAYYQRDDPPFFVEYAEAMSLVVTILVGLGSGLLGLREWVRRAKKNRIDVYYLEIDEVSHKMSSELAVDELNLLKAQLLRLRRQAFAELVRERLLADESFTIFQDYLRTELDEIDRAIKAKHRDLGLSDSGQYRRSESGSFRRSPLDSL